MSYKSNEQVVVNLKDFTGYAYTILKNGICPWCHKTKAEYIAEGYSIMTWDEFKILLDNYHNGLCGKWREITEDAFNDALNCLPPLAWNNGGFFLSEMFTHDVTDYYQKWYGKYYTSKQRLQYDRKDIIVSLESYIENS